MLTEIKKKASEAYEHLEVSGTEYGGETKDFILEQLDIAIKEVVDKIIKEVEKNGLCREYSCTSEVKELVKTILE